MNQTELVYFNDVASRDRYTTFLVGESLQIWSRLSARFTIYTPMINARRHTDHRATRYWEGCFVREDRGSVCASGDMSLHKVVCGDTHRYELLAAKPSRNDTLYYDRVCSIHLVMLLTTSWAITVMRTSDEYSFRLVVSLLFAEMRF